MALQNIYLIGICGVAMGSLAAMFHEKGYAVSGSDQNIYPPMSDLFAGRGIEQFNGYSADNVKNPDLVIVGNAISRGNPELEHVLNNRIPYMSMAQALYNFFLHDKEVIAICGTHGKSTTGALLAHILETAGFAPSSFIGGVAINCNSNYKIGSGGYFVIEGDEYDSAYFEKVPKFIFYRPDHLVLTSLEYDHADIYRDLAEIELWFGRLVNIIPARGNIVYSSDYINLADIVSIARSKRYSFSGGDSDFSYSFKGHAGEYSLLDIESPLGAFRLQTKLFGRFNFSNITAAVSMAKLLGASTDDIQKGVESFSGVKRRQEIIYDNGNVKIYEDFAHHPTAIKYMLETMRERYPGACLWAVYEPRSATSRRNVFQDVLPASFFCADEILIKTPHKGSAIRADLKLDIERLLNDISAFNEKVRILHRVDEIIQYISESIDLARDNVIVLMSNGGFDGIYKRLGDVMDHVIKAGVTPEGPGRNATTMRAGK
jgi:UDP-N-acetylmuramate: L-alanyl-gamma-D-glutamyl-meso-diaminopimelate ligase